MEREILTHIIALQGNIAVQWRGGQTFGIFENHDGYWTEVDCFTITSGVTNLYEAELYANEHLMNVLGYIAEEVE